MFNLFAREPTHCSHSASCLLHLSDDSVLSSSEKGIWAHFHSEGRWKTYLKAAAVLTAGMSSSNAFCRRNNATCFLSLGETLAALSTLDLIASHGSRW